MDRLRKIIFKASYCNGYITHCSVQPSAKAGILTTTSLYITLQNKYRPFNFKMWQPHSVHITQIWIQSYTQHIFYASQLH